MNISKFFVIYCLAICILKMTDSLTSKRNFEKENDDTKDYEIVDKVIPDYFFNTIEEVDAFREQYTNPTKKHPPPKKDKKNKDLDITEDLLLKALKDYRHNNHKELIKAVAQIFNAAIYNIPPPTETEEPTHPANIQAKINQLTDDGKELYNAFNKVIDEIYKPPQKDNSKGDVIMPSKSIQYGPFNPLKRRSKRSLEPQSLLYSDSYSEGEVNILTDTYIICSKDVHVLDYGANVKPRYVFEEQCVTSGKTQTAMSGEAVCYQKTVYVTSFQTEDNWTSYEEKEMEFNVACECECLDGGACYMMTQG